MPSQPGQVAAVLLQRLIGAFRVLARHTLGPSYLLQRAQQPFLRETEFLEDAPFLDHGEDDVFDAEIVVLQRSLFVFGFGQDLTEPGCYMELSRACPGSLNLRQLPQCLLHSLTDGGHRQSCLFEERGGKTSILLHEGKQKMFDINPLMTPPCGMGRCCLKRLL